MLRSSRHLYAGLTLVLSGLQHPAPTSGLESLQLALCGGGRTYTNIYHVCAFTAGEPTPESKVNKLAEVLFLGPAVEEPTTNVVTISSLLQHDPHEVVTSMQVQNPCEALSTFLRRYDDTIFISHLNDYGCWLKQWITSYYFNNTDFHNATCWCNKRPFHYRPRLACTELTIIVTCYHRFYRPYYGWGTVPDSCLDVRPYAKCPSCSKHNLGYFTHQLCEGIEDTVRSILQYRKGGGDWPRNKRNAMQTCPESVEPKNICRNSTGKL